MLSGETNKEIIDSVNKGMASNILPPIPLIGQALKPALETMMNYDIHNSNWVQNNIPQYIVNNEDNDSLLLFFSMIGQHFDNIYFHTKAIEKSRLELPRLDFNFGLLILLILNTSIFLSTRILPLDVVNRSHFTIILVFPMNLMLAVYIFLTNRNSNQKELA